MCVHGMLPIKDADVQRPGVLTLQEIIFNTLAKEKAHSYLSQPTCSELTKTNQVLSYIHEDLLAEVTSTQPKNISLSHLNLYKNITGLAACSDPNKVVMTSFDGSLITLDVITEEIHHKTISFDSIYAIDLNNKSFDCSYSSEKSISSQSETSSDYAFSSDEESHGDELISNINHTNSKDKFIYPAKYIDTVVSSNGQVWGAISPEHNDRLLIGSVDKLFDPKTSKNAQICNQINLAEDLGVRYGELKELALSTNGSQCAAVWTPLSSRFTDTQKLLFWDVTGSVQETMEMSRIQELVYAHDEPLVVVTHENGNISLWDTEKATNLSEIKFFEPGELIITTGLSQDNTTIYVASVIGKLCAFNREGKQTNQRCASKAGMVHIIQAHPQDLCVATATYDGYNGNVILWNKDITKRLAVLPYHATALSFSQDGTFLYIVTENKQFHRIPLGNPLELLCLRAYLACQNEPEQNGSFKNWDIYKKAIAQKQEERGILGEQLRRYLSMHTE